MKLTKILRLVLIPLMFLLFTCEEPVEKDTTPPTVSVSSHSSGQTVGEIVALKVSTNDNEGISKVEFYINNELVSTDTESPYEYYWNTTEVDDGDYIITVKSYDNSDNFTLSDPITLIIDNTSFVPQKVNVTNVTYSTSQMTIIWPQSQDSDFDLYKLWQSPLFDGEKSLLTTIGNQSTTSYTIQDFNPLVENWFWIEVADNFGLSTLGDGMSNEIDEPPVQLEIESVEIYVSKIKIKWEQFHENDFAEHNIYKSDTESGTKILISNITTQNLNKLELEDFNQYGENWFWVEAVDYWGQSTISNGMTNTIETDPKSVYLSFDGNGDNVRVPPNENIILPKEEITIEAWMKATNPPQQYQFLVSHGHSGPGYLLGWWSGSVWFQSRLLFDGQDYGLSVNYPTESLEWMHIAGVYDGLTFKLYINGELKDSAPGNGEIWTSTTIPLNFGTFAGGGYYFNGALDEIRIWSIARSEQQIKDNMNKLITEQQDGLVAYYRLNKGSSIIAKDYSDRSGNGAINGPNWIIE